MINRKNTETIISNGYTRIKTNNICSIITNPNNLDERNFFENLNPERVTLAGLIDSLVWLIVEQGNSTELARVTWIVWNCSVEENCWRRRRRQITIDNIRSVHSTMQNDIQYAHKEFQRSLWTTETSLRISESTFFLFLSMSSIQVARASEREREFISPSFSLSLSLARSLSS